MNHRTSKVVGAHSCRALHHLLERQDLLDLSRLDEDHGVDHLSDHSQFDNPDCSLECIDRFSGVHHSDQSDSGKSEVFEQLEVFFVSNFIEQ